MSLKYRIGKLKPFFEFIQKNTNEIIDESSTVIIKTVITSFIGSSN